MKIDLAIVSYDKDAASKGAGNADADRGAMGEAFGQAVRDAGGQRPGPSNEKAEDDAKVGKPEDDAEAAPAAPDAGADPDAKADDAPAADADPLTMLLGALVAAGGPKAPPTEATPARPEATKEEGAEAPLVVDPKLVAATAPEDAAAGTKRPMQLDVLRMETHFEPRQDGMVLVEGAVEASKAAGSAPADPKAGAAVPVADGLAGTLADLVKPKTADAGAKPAADKASAKADGSLPPMRFDEALAQLGRGDGGERSGGDPRRGGSASGQSPLAEIAARRNAPKAADGIALAGASSIADPMPSSSPYNLAGQVAGPIMDALGEPARAPAQASSASTDAHLRMRAGGGALKTLTIQLQPEHLGTVDVSLRLNEGRLTLELAASRSDTASMLLDDQASLRKLLEHAGFSLDDAAISVITRDNGQVRTADSNAANSQQRDGSGGAAGGEGRSDARGRSGGSDEQPARRQTPQRGGGETASTPSRSGATYL